MQDLFGAKLNVIYYYRYVLGESDRNAISLHLVEHFIGNF